MTGGSVLEGRGLRDPVLRAFFREVKDDRFTGVLGDGCSLDSFSLCRYLRRSDVSACEPGSQSFFGHKSDLGPILQAVIFSPLVFYAHRSIPSLKTSIEGSKNPAPSGTWMNVTSPVFLC
jgi:hypothetical protein